MEYHSSMRGVPDTWFEPDEESTNITNEFLDYIREEYVWTAYDKLFGEEISEACIDVLWEMLSDETVLKFIITENILILWKLISLLHWKNTLD